MVATSLARERVGNHSCDGRRRRSELALDFPAVDFVEVEAEDDDMWPHKEDPPHGAVLPQYSSCCLARAQRLLQWLWERPEKDIAVVTHWVFLQHLLRPYPELADAKPFGNAELRHVTLVRGPPPDRVREEL